MKVGLIGLGKMGMNLAKNLIDPQIIVHAYDVNSASVESLQKYGAIGSPNMKDIVDKLEQPRVIWLMVPHTVVDNVIEELFPLLSPGDILIDGGNSNYKESMRRSRVLKEAGIYFMDVGTSGGMEGARNGACYMIGGNQNAWKVIEPLFAATSVPNGYLYAGDSGSGHYLKMVHNGIEYGMMAAIGEGFEILEKSEFNFDYEQVARVWNNGSVVRSWLMELTEQAFAKDARLEEIKGVMHSSGEGKWALETALDLQASTPVMALALLMRFRSQENDTFNGKVVAALRNEFGGHKVEKNE